MKMAGTLYIVATPIGNLEDMTKRAERVLSAVDRVACEDTRRTRKLLTSLGISKPLVSYYEPREEKAVPKIIGMLKDGDNVALVTDGGTPAVSDPGYRLVKAAADEGIKVVPVPGASALAAAVSASGLPSDRFTFSGFPPKQAGKRRKLLEELATRRDTLVFYESPNRVVAFMKDALDVLGERETVVFREMTKMFEERISGALSEVIGKVENSELKGEFTVLVSGSEGAGPPSDEMLAQMVEDALADGEKMSALASRIARETGLNKQTVYDLALRLKK